MAPPPPPFRFTFVRPIELGFALESDDRRVWPRFAEVVLQVVPVPRNDGLQFFLPVGMAPRWAAPWIELGVLHACLVGGPGGLQIADLAISVARVRWDPIASGERSMFLAAYLAMRQIIHDAVRSSPSFLEFHRQLTFPIPAIVEPRIVRDLHDHHGSGVEISASANGAWSRISVDLPMIYEPPILDRIASLSPGGHLPPIEREPLGFRGLSVMTVPELLAHYGPPLDWPAESAADVPVESQFPRLGDPFPELPLPHDPIVESPHPPHSPFRRFADPAGMPWPDLLRRERLY